MFSKSCYKLSYFEFGSDITLSSLILYVRYQYYAFRINVIMQEDIIVCSSSGVLVHKHNK